MTPLRPAFAVLLLLSACSRAPAPPNVLLVSIDMLRPDHLGCYGYERATSPAIDRLAAEGALFENHVSSTSWTLPAHAALFTSLADSIHGCTDADKRLADERTTLAERFQAQGYETAGFFSGPFLHPVFGLGQGFERYENCTSYQAALDANPDSRAVMQSSHEDVTNPNVFAAFERWIGARDEEEPFFAFLHMWDVHFDFLPPPPYDTRFDPDYEGTLTGRGFFFDPEINAEMPARDLEHLIALYDGEIAWTDSFLAKIRAELERRGLLESTIVAITSDHGTEFFEHGRKGHRMTLYDEVIKTPLVLRYPKSIPAGRRIAAQTSIVDVGPTLLELAGFAVPEEVVGKSLVALARDPAAQHPERATSELFSVGRNLRAVRTRAWKFEDDIGRGDYRYFDLAADPRELVPLVDRTSALGRSAEQGYLGKVADLETFLQKHPPVAATSRVPDDVAEQLRRFGYTGEEDEPPPDPDAPK